MRFHVGGYVDREFGHHAAHIETFGPLGYVEVSFRYFQPSPIHVVKKFATIDGKTWKEHLPIKYNGSPCSLKKVGPIPYVPAPFPPELTTDTSDTTDVHHEVDDSAAAATATATATEEWIWM